MNFMKKVSTELQKELHSIVNTMGYDFIGCELTNQQGQRLLRIYIDKEYGVSLADCTAVSHQISAMLDVENPVQGYYTLEVSSPGLDRPLFELEQYQKQVGQRVKIRLYTPINNQRQFTGVLLQIEGNTIHLLTDTKEMTLPYSNIEKANIIADIR